jgi:hypothetical protein
MLYYMTLAGIFHNGAKPSGRPWKTFNSRTNRNVKLHSGIRVAGRCLRPITKSSSRPSQAITTNLRLARAKAEGNSTHASESSKITSWFERHGEVTLNTSRHYWFVVSNQARRFLRRPSSQCRVAWGLWNYCSFSRCNRDMDMCICCFDFPSQYFR